mmetsp:Transcript_40587/g.71408  ORF Transcript_40587/g.71408 Transcript_40587/m.71408 type:complete len:114 (-) Transcript_40587:7-348(-)
MFSCCAAPDEKAQTIEAITEEAPAKQEVVVAPEPVAAEPEEPAPTNAPEPVPEAAPEPETNEVEEAPPAPEPAAPEPAKAAEPDPAKAQMSAIDELMASMADDIEQINKKAEG